MTAALDAKKPRVSNLTHHLTNSAVLLLPTETSRVIVQYDPLIRISAVLSPTTRKVLATRSPYDTNLSKWTQELEIKTPALIISGVLYLNTGIPGIGDQTITNLSIWEVDLTRQDGIYTSNYVVGNVHGGGNICFGSVTPSGLRHANSCFWNVPFTDHMWPGKHQVCRGCALGQVTHTCPGRKGAKKHKFGTEHKPKHSCDCSRAIFHKHGLYTIRESLGASSYALNYKKFLKKTKTAAGSLEEMWKLTEGICRRRYMGQDILRNKTTVKPTCNCCSSIIDDKKTCACTSRHKRTCLCQNPKAVCGCPCKCDCCKNTCNCKCACACCTNRCQHTCSCKQAKFVKFLQEYKTQPHWTNTTAAICGNQFFSKPCNAGGVLLSADPQVLELVPKKYHRTFKINTRDPNDYYKIITQTQDFVIALGQPVADDPNDSWEFVAGTCVFRVAKQHLKMR